MARAFGSPTVRQRELGKRLRYLRTQRDLTVEDVAQRLLCSATKVSRLETGARLPSLRDVRDLCALYEVDEPTSAELMSLAREARERGWWTAYEDLNLDPFIGFEQDATAITFYSMQYMPGLLQTEDYARGIIRAIAPQMDPQIVGQRVEARLRRQEVLERQDPPHYTALLDEAVLRRGVGGPAIMAAQFDKIIQAVSHDKATVQVIPFRVGAYAASDGNFILLEFDRDFDLGPIVYIEGLTANQYLERGADVARYRETIEYLLNLALSPQDSVQCMVELRDTYAGE